MAGHAAPFRTPSSGLQAAGLAGIPGPDGQPVPAHQRSAAVQPSAIAPGQRQASASARQIASSVKSWQERRP